MFNDNPGLHRKYLYAQKVVEGVRGDSEIPRIIAEEYIISNNLDNGIIGDMGVGEGEFGENLKSKIIRFDREEPEEWKEEPFVIGDIRTTGFPDNYFNCLVYSYSLQCNYLSYKKYLIEGCRILKPGGFLILVEPKQKQNREKWIELLKNSG